MSFSVGDRVSRTVKKNSHGDYDCRGGKIVSILNDIAIVEWDKAAWERDSSVEKIKIASLVTESEAKNMVSMFEAEFNSLSSNIKTKMEEVAKLIREADKMAEEQGFNMIEMWEAHRPLRDAMDEAGWSTSSLNC